MPTGRIRLIRGVPLVGYRWWTVGRWTCGVKLGPVTVQVTDGVDVSVLNRWRVIIY